MNRPALAASSAASDLARRTGECSGGTRTPVPSSTRSVTAAAWARVMSGSVVRPYRSGHGRSGTPYRPCSPLWSKGNINRSYAQRLSNPIRSAARAKAVTSRARS
jgi:hypothetical protein